MNDHVLDLYINLNSNEKSSKWLIYYYFKNMLILPLFILNLIILNLTKTSNTRKNNLRIYCVVQILLGSLAGGKQKIGMFLHKNSAIFIKSFDYSNKMFIMLFLCFKNI
jgi:membrane-associated HD superfamily phosphohydrolase